MRLSRDSGRLARLKLVISVNHAVDSELARYRRRKGCFPKPILRSSFLCEHLFYDVPVASYKVHNL